MLPQLDYPKDLGGPCRFVALRHVLAAVLMERCFIIIVTQESRFTEIEEGFDSVRGTAR